MKPTAGIRILMLICLAYLLHGCANIVPPSGGKKDVTPPQLLLVSPPDSQLNVRPTKIDLRFDEYVVLSDVPKEIQFSPLLPVPPTVIVANKKVSLSLPDTLLMDSTTYRISFGKAIRDLHENNPFEGYQYVFSTGAFFDSLWIEGKVLQARTGMPDTGAFVLLFPAADSDSAVLKDKPHYAIKVGQSGSFRFDGLPPRAFKIYALQDKNDNMRFDGEEERIAFLNTMVDPRTDSLLLEPLRTFKEILVVDSTDTVKVEEPGRKGVGKRGQKEKVEELTYRVSVDTSNIERRTFDVTKPLIIDFNRELDSVALDRITLARDSNDVEVPVAIDISLDTALRTQLVIKCEWKEDAVYVLRLLKGFAADSAGVEAMPSRHQFRTKSIDDYARLVVNLGSEYLDSNFVLFIQKGDDTLYHAGITDSTYSFNYLTEAIFQFYIIVDENENGEWDTGDLLQGKQPEHVIPHKESVRARSGWEHIVDFQPLLFESKSAKKENADSIEVGSEAGDDIESD